jgi:anti-sigma B factor antagonist
MTIMTMKSRSRKGNDVTILDLSGRMTLGEDTILLRETIRDLISQGRKMILLNLGDVPYIDSSGIGELVYAFTSVKKNGGELKLLNLTKKVRDVLQITKLYTVFDVYLDEEGAIHAFEKEAAPAMFVG